MLTEDEFQRLVIREAHGRATDDEQAILSGDPGAWRAAAASILSSISQQIAIRRAVGDSIDPEWYKKTLHIKSVLERRMPTINAAVTKMHMDEETARRRTDLRSLLEAIRGHREWMTEQDFEPSEADVRLWAVYDDIIIRSST